MNQENIGKFIAECRKNKNMTQQELADMLNVTNRAISNWENGRRMPDVSFFKPLCEILGISVNELINGRHISEDKKNDVFDNTIIDTLDKSKKQKKKSNNIILCLIIVLLILIIFTILISNYYKKLYPKIDIYSLVESLSDDQYSLKKQFSIRNENTISDIYYYGIETAQLCDPKNNCYEIKVAMDYKQTDIDDIKKFFESQYELGNVDKYMFWDGGITLFLNDRYQVMFCNTISGNKDVYFGKPDMLDELDGEYCGHEKNTTKSFIRTYHVLGSKEDSDDKEFSFVTLSDIDGNTATVKINNSHNIVVGRTYEFSFYTFDYFEDTIENIFEYSTFLEAKETDKQEHEYINEPIYVNDDLESGAELNELKHVKMEIKEGSLTNISATIIITDYSGHKYIYGDTYTIERLENDEWVEVNNGCNNCVSDLVAYGVDVEGKLIMDLDWHHTYGYLGSGKYRIVKDVLPNLKRAVSESDVLYLSCEFEIE